MSDESNKTITRVYPINEKLIVSLKSENTKLKAERDELKRKLDVAREALQFYEQRQHILTEYLPNKIEIGAVAAKALKEIEE